MEIDKKNRTELKQYFKANDKPTEKQFVDFIEAGINQAEDGIAKVQGNPLAIEAQGEDVGIQDVLGLYRNFSEDAPDWSLNLNPRIDPENPDSNQSGLNIKDSIGQSRLFIKSGNGNVGVGTIEPTAKLTIKGNNDASLLAVVDTTNEHTTILEVTQKEGVSIKGPLNVDGDFTSNNIKEVAVNNDLGNTAASDEKVPTQKAVKTYIDNRLPKGLISMWSGKVTPDGWALCDGTNETPNLSGRFIVGFDKNTPDYNEIGKTGGVNEVILTTGQLPAHTHEDQGHSHSINDPGHNHEGKLNESLYKGGSSDKEKYFDKHKNTNFKGLVKVTGSNTTSAGTSTDGETGYGYEFDLQVHGELQPSTTGITINTASANLKETGGNQPHENRPPYYVLAYIMKL